MPMYPEPAVWTDLHALLNAPAYRLAVRQLKRCIGYLPILRSTICMISEKEGPFVVTCSVSLQ